MDNTKDTPEAAPKAAAETIISNEAEAVKTSVETDQASEQNESKKLGELLLSYREKVGMDLDQAADAMCLTRGTLEALENEDFHLLPEAPYIRGYLRGYAKLAGVSSAEAVALYESIRGGDPLMQTPYHFTPSAKDDNLATQGWSSSLWKVMGTVLAVLLLLGLWTIPEVKSWVHDTWAEFSQKTSSELADGQEKEEDKGEEDKSAEGDSKKAETSNETTMPPESELVGKIRREGDVPDIAQNDKVSPDKPEESPAEDKDNKPKDSEQTSEDNKTEGDKPTDDKKAENAEGNTEDSSNTEDKKEDDNSSNESDTQQAENTNEADGETIAVDLSDVDTEAGEVAIKLMFEDEVWMRIKKKGGKTVFAGLRKKGEVHEMKSVKPLKFKVGNAPGVKIYINGKLFDQDPYQRGVVSRFDVE
jgi:cytoskeleton protein RodZ